MTTAPTSVPSPPSRVTGYRSVLVGGFVWGATLLVLCPRPMDAGWAVALLLLAPLVLVPLALGLIGPTAATYRLWRFVVLLQPLAALLLAGAYLLPQGLASATLALPWLGMTGLLALLGLKRLRNRHQGVPGEIGVAAALVYIGIGGFWAVLDRWGADRFSSSL